MVFIRLAAGMMVSLHLNERCLAVCAPVSLQELKSKLPGIAEDKEEAGVAPSAAKSQKNSKGSKKGMKGGKDMSSLFAALEEDAESECSRG